MSSSHITHVLLAAIAVFTFNIWLSLAIIGPKASPQSHDAFSQQSFPCEWEEGVSRGVGINAAVPVRASPELTNHQSYRVPLTKEA